MPVLRPLWLVGSILIGSAPQLLATETIQVDMAPLLNVRVVTTLAQGKLIPWRESLDNGGSGMATQSAAAYLGNDKIKALPDDGVFPATDRHPWVKLNFGNGENFGNQARRSVAEDQFELPVPLRHYLQLSLFCMSGRGASQLTVHLYYVDGSVETRSIEVPDWWSALPSDDPVRFNLAADLGKWDQDGKLMEPNHHAITGLELRPNPNRVLARLQIEKSAPAVLTLWGITGVAD